MKNSPCAGDCAGPASKPSRKTPPFVKVLDHRQRPIRGLWMRGERYYARLNIAGSDRRLPLEASNLTQARAELTRLSAANSDHALALAKRGPAVSEFVPVYVRKR